MMTYPSKPIVAKQALPTLPALNMEERALCEALRDRVLERAAIMEIEGELPRIEAEKLASAALWRYAQREGISTRIAFHAIDLAFSKNFETGLHGWRRELCL